jgi:hypothetical protein
LQPSLPLSISADNKLGTIWDNTSWVGDDMIGPLQENRKQQQQQQKITQLIHTYKRRLECPASSGMNQQLERVRVTEGERVRMAVGSKKRQEGT